MNIFILSNNIEASERIIIYTTLSYITFVPKSIQANLFTDILINTKES